MPFSVIGVQLARKIPEMLACMVEIDMTATVRLAATAGRARNTAGAEISVALRCRHVHGDFENNWE